MPLLKFKPSYIQVEHIRFCTEYSKKFRSSFCSQFLFIDAILVCYVCFQMFHHSKGFVICLHNVILSCILASRHYHIHRFFQHLFLDRPPYQRLLKLLCFICSIYPSNRSQCLRSLRRRSTVSRLLRLGVGIPPGACMFVCF